MSSIEKVLADIKSPVEETRLKALNECIKLSDVKVLPALRDLVVNDESVQVRYYAKKALHFIKSRVNVTEKSEGDQKESIEDEFVRIFSLDDDDTKINLVQRAVKLNQKKCVPLIEKFLMEQENPFVKSKLIIALGILGGKNQIETLKTYLNDNDYRIKANTIEALGYIGDRSVYPIILSALSDTDNRVRANAIKIINKFGKSKVSELLNEMITSDEIPMVMSAIEVINQIKRLEALPLLKKAFEKNNPTICSRIIEVLENFSKTIPEAADLLDFLKKKIQLKSNMKSSPNAIENIMVTRTREMLKSRDAKIRLKGISQCFEVKSPIILEDIKTLMGVETDSYVKAAGVNALGRIGRLTWAPYIEKFLSDPDNRTRANTVEVLGALRDPETARKLIPMLNDSNNRVKANAVMALWDFSEIDAFPVLEKMIDLQDQPMCQSAIFVIMDIEDDPRAINLLEKLAVQGSDTLKGKALESLQILSDSEIEYATEILGRLQKKRDIKKIQQKAREAVKTASKNIDSADSPINSGPDGYDIERILFDLESENEAARQKAARILESIGDENCLDRLQNAMKDSSNSVRYYAGKAFNAIKRRIDFKENILKLRPSGKNDQIDLDELKKLLEQPDRDVRISAIQQVKITDYHTLDILVKHLPGEEDDFVKPALVSCIGMLGDDDVVPLLLPYLQEKDSRVRANTIEALEYTCCDTVFPHIVPMLQDNNNRVKANAIKALQNAGKKNALNMLADMSASKEIWMRDSAAYALGTIKDPIALDLLISIFEKEKSLSIAAKSLNSISLIITKQGYTKIVSLKQKIKDKDKLRLLNGLDARLRGKKINFYSLIEQHGKKTSASILPKYEKIDPPKKEPAEIKPQKMVSETIVSEAKISPAKISSAKVSPAKVSPAKLSPAKDSHAKVSPAKVHGIAAKLVENDLTDKKNIKKEKIAEKPNESVDPKNDLKAPEKRADTPAPNKKVFKLIKKLSLDLDSSNAETRKKAVVNLSKMDFPEVIPLLKKATKDKDTIVKVKAKTALKSIERYLENNGGTKPEQVNKQSKLPQKVAAIVIGLILVSSLFLGSSFLYNSWLSSKENIDQPDMVPGNSSDQLVQTIKTDPNPVSIKMNSNTIDMNFINNLKKGLISDKTDFIEALKWGNFNARKKKYSRAVENFKKALEIEPKNIEAGLKYIYCLKKSGTQRLAMSFYSNMMSSSVTAEYLYSLASPSKSIAKKKINDLISKNNSQLFAKITQAYFEAEKKNFLKAGDILSDIYINFKENILLLVKASEFYLSGGNTTRALELLNSPDFNTTEKKIYSGLGKINAYMHLGRLSGAVQEAERLMKSNPLNPEILFKMGKCRFKQKRFDEASDYLKRSVALNSSNFKALYLLAQALDFTGDHKEALRLIKSASMLDPECQETWIAANGDSGTYVPPRAHGDNKIFLPEKTALNIDPDLFEF